MSQENVEVVREMCDAYNDGDFERALEQLHPDVEWHGTTGGVDEGQVARGHREVIQGFVDSLEAWESQRLEATKFIEAGADRVVVFWHEVAKGRQSGIEVESKTAVIYTVRGGSVVRVDPYMDRSQALEAAGLSEEAMSEENVEIIRRNTDAYNRGDLDGFMEGWASDAVVNWSNSRGFEAATYRGRDEVRAFAQRFREAFEEVRIELVDDPTEIQDGLVFAENVTYFRGRDGIEVQARSAWLVTFENGEQTSLTMYQTKQEALEAAGLSG